MVQVNAATTDEGKRREAYAEMAAAKAEAALTTIAADIATLDGAYNTADVVAILKRSLVRERAEIKALLYVIRDLTGG